MKTSVFIGLLLISSLSLQAQDDEVGAISTDRPMQCETPITVPKGHIQFESGIQFEKKTMYYTSLFGDFKGPETEQTTLPNLYFKYGLLERLDVQLALNYRSVSEPDPLAYFLGTDPDKRITTTGFDSPILGLKYRILKQKANLKGSNLSISAHGYIPIGGGDFAEDNLNVSTRLTWNKTLLRSWYVSCGAGATASDDRLDKFLLIAQTGVTIKDKITLALEYYNSVYIIPFSNVTNAMGAINAAVILALAQNHQLDVSLGTAGFNDVNRQENQFNPLYHDFYIGIGYSCRFRL